MVLTAATVVHLFAPIHLVKFYLTELTAANMTRAWKSPPPLPSMLAPFA